MTGRRAMRGPDQRLSRALQFIPGHVGGRVASAQPIRRRGGTLRQASVGAVAVPECPFPLHLVPDSITIDNTGSPFTWSLVGGASGATIGDDLDTTYVRCTYPSSDPGGGPFSVGIFFEFAAVSLPVGATVTSATLGARVRSSTAGTLLQYAVAGDILDTYTPLYTEATGTPWSAGTDWANKTDLTTWTNTPSAAQLAAGAIQGYVLPAATYTDGRTFDIAEAWLTIEGTC